MKRPPARAIVAVLVVLLAGTVYVTREQWQPLLGLSPDDNRYLGYVEGETSLIAPPSAGRLIERPVNRGDRVKKGDRLFVIDPVVAKAEVARSEAALAEAKARFENLLTGKRQEELDVIRSQQRETEAALVMAETELKRQSDLVARGYGTRQAYEQAESQARQLRSRLASLSAQEKVANLAARPDEIDAAKALIVQSQANLDQARKKLEDLMPVAPEDALIENTFFNVGEWVPAGTPVLSLLPPQRVKLRFFVPEEDIARAKPGDKVGFTCDTCPAGLMASIIYISPRAEFTPPVIYSQSARTKLVFLVEAQPDSSSTALPPGLPVSVAPLVK
ncbi:MAG: HlyD family secretion protein [Reyranella sp.]|uniref:HlyD family secretion protein n=1 Tax=Reyranella sp. TaxID=1929291 RepID=UPI003D0A8B58